MKPEKFTRYTLRSSGEEFCYIGPADLLHDGGVDEIYVLCRVVSGYDEAQRQRLAEGKTNFLICDPDDFETLFEEVPGLGELTPAAQARRDTE